MTAQTLWVSSAHLSKPVYLKKIRLILEEKHISLADSRKIADLEIQPSVQ